MTREEIREITMQIIFQMDVSGDFDYSNILPIEENTKVLKEKQAIDTLTQLRDHITDIDKLIIDNLDKWKPERVAKTDFAILRTAVTEMRYIDYIPTSVSINEAVELAKKFGEEKSYAFINSVLSKIAKAI